MLRMGWGRCNQSAQVITIVIIRAQLKCVGLTICIFKLVAMRQKP